MTMKDLSEGFFLLKLFYNVNITYTIKYFWKKKYQPGTPECLAFPVLRLNFPPTASAP